MTSPATLRLLSDYRHMKREPTEVRASSGTENTSKTEPLIYRRSLCPDRLTKLLLLFGVCTEFGKDAAQRALDKCLPVGTYPGKCLRCSLNKKPIFGLIARARGAGV